MSDNNPRNSARRMLPTEIDPTATIDPGRPRTLRAEYDRETRTVTMEFREGAVYEYYDVPSDVWRRLHRTVSTGKFINRVLNGYDYERISG